MKRDSESGRHAAAKSGATAAASASGVTGAGANAFRLEEAISSRAGIAVPHKKRWVPLASVAVLVLAALIAGRLYYRSHQAKPLTDKDTIVIADFDNKTGDAVFDGTLKTGLTVALNQSPFLNVLSDSKVAATLKLMTLPVDTRLTPELYGSFVYGRTAEHILPARLLVSAMNM